MDFEKSMLLKTLILYPLRCRKAPTWESTPPLGSTTTKLHPSFFFALACKICGVSQNRVLPEPDEPITQALRLRALAGFFGRVFMVRNSVPVRITLFSKTGSTNGAISLGPPHLADPYSSSRLYFFAFLLLA